MVSTTIKYEETFCCHYFQLPVPSNNPENDNDDPAKNPAKSASVLTILDELFESVSAELIHLVEKGNKKDHFYPVLLLYELEKYIGSGGPNHMGSGSIVRTNSLRGISHNVSYYLVTKIANKVENT